MPSDNDALFPLWNPKTPFPPHDEMRDLDYVTHISVIRARRGEYHYLHEPSLAWHKDRLYVCWANHPTHEVNVRDELVRSRYTDDGGHTWSEPVIWAAPPQNGSESYNHTVLTSQLGHLWGFFARWENELPSTEVFVLDEDSGAMVSLKVTIPGFVPFQAPFRMKDGNWIMGGEAHWYEAAVAISDGDNFRRWRMVQIPRPETVKLMFPETMLMDQGDRIVAICRPRDAGTAPVAVSRDCGRSWTLLEPSNFPLCSTQTYCGKLSTGQHFLLSGNREEGRTLMSIAVAKPGGRVFEKVWKVRHQKYPKRRLLGAEDGRTRVGEDTEWSYPAAVERDGNLYVCYTHGKEDCALSVIPVAALSAG